MLTQDSVNINIRLNKIRKFFLNPIVFFLIFTLSIGTTFFVYQNQHFHESAELASQKNRETIEDISKIATLISLFFGVLNWLATSEIKRKEASLEAVDNFLKKYLAYRHTLERLDIDRNTSYREYRASCRNHPQRLIDTENAFDSILASCEELCIAMDQGIVDESFVKTCLIGAFLEVGEWLLEYIEEKQHDHPGRWIHCLETIARWHHQKPEFDIQAMIDKNRCEQLINSIRTHQMLLSASRENPQQVF